MSNLNIEEKLNEIWTRDYIESFPTEITDRKFCYAINEDQRDILITGINPSFRNNEKNGIVKFHFDAIANDAKHDTYWSSLKRIVCSDDLNYLYRTAYLDILYYREKEQDFLKKVIFKNPNGVQFIVDQLNLSQNVIEKVIQPKIIIVKNKESAAFWGRYSNDGIIWMGYDLELVASTRFGEVNKIIGLVDSDERIAPEIEKSNLEGSIILFTHHINQYTSKEKRPTAKLVNVLLDFYESGNINLENI